MPIGIDLSGYLIEELRNDSNFEDFKEDIANADIFVASLIFIEDLAQKGLMQFLHLKTNLKHQLSSPLCQR